MLSVARQQLLLFVPASGDPLQEACACLNVTESLGGLRDSVGR